MPDNQTPAAIFDMWMRAWTGETELIDDIFAPHCQVHQAGNDGKVVEYWVSSDGMHLKQQLQP